MPCPQPSDQYWRKVNLEITTVCNLACPDCSAGINMGLRNHRHHPWEYFVEAARWLRGVEQLVIIGGEPLTHPKFDLFSTRWRDLFGCRELIVWTNGFQAEKHAEALKRFDAVYASLYDSETGHDWNKRSNRSSVEFIKLNYAHSTMEQPHVPRSLRGSGQLCERGVHGPVTYADGKLFGCCVAPGMPEGVGIEPTDNWRQEILKVPLPCETCCFSPEAG